MCGARTPSYESAGVLGIRPKAVNGGGPSSRCVAQGSPRAVPPTHLRRRTDGGAVRRDRWAGAPAMAQTRGESARCGGSAGRSQGCAGPYGCQAGRRRLPTLCAGRWVSAADAAEGCGGFPARESFGPRVGPAPPPRRPRSGWVHPLANVASATRTPHEWMPPSWRLRSPIRAVGREVCIAGSFCRAGAVPGGVKRSGVIRLLSPAQRPFRQKEFGLRSSDLDRIPAWLSCRLDQSGRACLAGE